MKSLFSFLVLFLISWNVIAQDEVLYFEGQEEIRNYDVDITVLEDRSIKVREVITVFARGEGWSIQRGIYRTIPTAVVDRNNNPVPTNFELNTVLKDGDFVDYQVEESNNYVAIRIGSEDVFLDEGEYTYTISYTVSEQVRWFEEYDEIYWNAIGNQWDFNIRSAHVTVHLPTGTEIIQESAYTGMEGEKKSDYRSEKIDNTTIQYEISKTLPSNNGLTIAVGFTKGVVTESTQAELDARERRKWLPAILMILGLFLVVGYYIYAWKKVGVDPKKQSIIPRFEPPEGLSPAAVRFIMNMGFDNKTFSASIISMAVKRYVIINKVGKHYELTISPEKQNNLTIEEQKVANELFVKGNTILIKQENHSTIGKAKRDLGKQLSLDYEKQNFKHNYHWLAPGFILTLLTFILTMTFINNEQLMGRVIGCIFITFILGIFATLSFYNISNAGKVGKVLRSIIGSGLICLILFIPFYLFNDTEQLIEINFIFFYLPILLLFFFNGLFTYLMKAPTVKGREIMDKIEGLKIFIKTAEKDRLDMLNPPEKTPELFEKLLPYAIALDVENKWSSQFSKILEKAMEDGSYNPVWYHGSNMHSISYITSDLGSSFSSSLSTASVSPSSGSGGGGSSGGGGGGGGGGGW